MSVKQNCVNFKTRENIREAQYIFPAKKYFQTNIILGGTLHRKKRPYFTQLNHEEINYSCFHLT